MGGLALNKKRQALGPRCLSPHKSPSQRIGGVVGGFERAKSAWWMALFFGRVAGRPVLPGTCQVMLLARPWPGRPVQRPCRQDVARGVTAGFGWRDARLAGTPNSAGRQTIWRSQFVQGAVRAADQAVPPISPALPCLARLPPPADLRAARLSSFACET